MLTRLFVIMLIFILTSAHSFALGEDIPNEYLVKAKYLLNVPLFTDSPSQTKTGSSYVICVIGDTPLESILNSSKRKMIRNRPLMIRKVDEIKQADGCQMLFIASSERHRLQKLLPEAQRNGILTISDMRDFARMGGIFSLIIVDNRISFDLNLSAANKSSITFSTNLLKLARDIID